MSSPRPEAPASGSTGAAHSPGKLPLVAVIAIHGVGRHEPGSSAEAIATLLASADRANTAQDYLTLPAGPHPLLGYDIQLVEVPLAAVATTLPLAAPPPKHWYSAVWSVFDERHGFLDRKRQESAEMPSKARGEVPASAPPQEHFDYQYMLSQLAEYQAEPGRTFQTMRYASRGTKAKISGTQNSTDQLTDVLLPPSFHIYDAHYSDLSKPESSIVGFFYAFYQLLFHLAALGLKAVYWAEAENAEQGPRGWPWRILSSFHATAVRMLTMFIPLLNLVMLAIGLAAFADKFSSSWQIAAGLSLAGAMGLVATLIVGKKFGSPRRPFFWSGIPFLGAALSMAILGLAAVLGNWCLPEISIEKWLVLLAWLVVAGIAVLKIAQKFSEMRPGAGWVGGLLYLLNVMLFLLLFLRRAAAPDEPQAATAAFLTIQVVFGELAFCWVTCLLAEFFSWPLSELCTALANEPARKCRARAAHRTGRFTFAISASFFLIVTLAIWSGIANYASRRLHIFKNVSAMTIDNGSVAAGWRAYVIPDTARLEARIASLKCDPGAQLLATKWAGCPKTLGNPTAPWRPLENYLDGLLLVSVTPGLPVTLALIALSFLMLLWAVLPSVIFESSQHVTPPSDSVDTGRAGEWLSRGLDNIAILIRILWFAIVPTTLFFGSLNLLRWHGFIIFPTLVDTTSRWTLPLIQGTGAALAVSATALVAVILKYGGAVLDTLLDVDNYLRTVPAHMTPRARIAERCTSLLRYVAAYRDTEGRPYQRLVIVAHSLGTLVAADLLRFIARSAANDKDPVLHKDGLHAGADAPAIPIYLLTMGSPLRALLHRFFPHLYEWVTVIPDNSSAGSELGASLENAPAEIGQQALPRTDELCVKGWCNVYRSADYVGRYLWNVGWLKRNDAGSGGGPISVIRDASPASRAEMCIGIGAHTHYWDRTAPDVGEALRKLIVDPTEIFS